MPKSDTTTSKTLFRSDIAVKSIDEVNRTVDYIASTEAVDSYGEIVEQDWILDRYTKNPVILYNHNRSNGNAGLTQDETLPIGRAVEWAVIKVKGKPALYLKVQFAPADLHPFAEKVFGLVRTGFLKGGSVGFNPHDVRRETRDDVETYILSKNELFEFSITPIGANPDAVSLSHDDIANHRALLKELAMNVPLTRRSTTPSPVLPLSEDDIIERDDAARHEKNMAEALAVARARNLKTFEDRQEAENLEILAGGPLPGQEGEWSAEHATKYADAKHAFEKQLIEKRDAALKGAAELARVEAEHEAVKRKLAGVGLLDGDDIGNAPKLKGAPGQRTAQAILGTEAPTAFDVASLIRQPSKTVVQRAPTKGAATPGSATAAAILGGGQ